MLLLLVAGQHALMATTAVCNCGHPASVFLQTEWHGTSEVARLACCTAFGSRWLDTSQVLALHVGVHESQVSAGQPHTGIMVAQERGKVGIGK
jgi:hypothetical protein